MSEINAALVAKLREMTGAGLMDCKKALTEAKGDLSKAVDILRKKGAATAVSKATREAKEGVIAFRLATNSAADFDKDVQELVAKIRENIKVARHARMEVNGNGMVAAYIHTGAKIGVLVEVGAGKENTATNDEFRQLVKDITLQIAAGHPFFVSRDQVPAAELAKEKEIAAEQVKNKPAQAIAKIVEGKLEKYYQTHCLVDQGFVKKNSEISVKEHVGQIAKRLGDEITIRRFVRFQVGESSPA